MYIETTTSNMNMNEDVNTDMNSNLESESDSDSDSIPELVSNSDDEDSGDGNSPTNQDRSSQAESMMSIVIPGNNALDGQSRTFVLNSNDSLYNQFYTYFQGIAEENQSANRFAVPSQTVLVSEEPMEEPAEGFTTPPRSPERISGSGSGSNPPPPPPPSRRQRRQTGNQNQNIAYPALDISALLMASFNQLQIQQEEAQYQRDLETATQASVNEEQPVTKRVIQDGLFDTFRRIEYDDTVGEDLGYTQCPIDYEEFEEGEILVELPCGHCFSYRPIEKWLTTESSKCPMCRQEMDYKEMVVRQRIGGDQDQDSESNGVGDDNGNGEDENIVRSIILR